MSNILIIGKGIVGHNLGEELSHLKPHFVDKYKPELNTYDEGKTYKIGFICVDTPILEDYSLETDEIKNAIEEYKCEMFVVKSTMPVGTTDKLMEETGKPVIFSPEYYGSTLHANNFNFSFTILGGEKELSLKAHRILQKAYDARHRFYFTDSKTAETVKFMENAWLALKVTYVNEFNRYCERIGINYEELRELFILDPRVNPSHTYVFKETPFWDTHCLNKDVPHMAYINDIELLKKVCEINERYKNKQDK